MERKCERRLAFGIGSLDENGNPIQEPGAAERLATFLVPRECGLIQCPNRKFALEARNDLISTDSALHQTTGKRFMPWTVQGNYLTLSDGLLTVYEGAREFLNGQ
jgi:hypothetical protein